MAAVGGHRHQRVVDGVGVEEAVGVPVVGGRVEPVDLGDGPDGEGAAPDRGAGPDAGLRPARRGGRRSSRTSSTSSRPAARRRRHRGRPPRRRPRCGTRRYDDSNPLAECHRIPPSLSPCPVPISAGRRKTDALCHRPTLSWGHVTAKCGPGVHGDAPDGHHPAAGAGYHARHGCGSARLRLGGRARAGRVLRLRAAVRTPAATERPGRHGAADHGGRDRLAPSGPDTGPSDPEGRPFSRTTATADRRRRRGWCWLASLVMRFWTRLRPVARRGPDRQHRPPPAPRAPVLPQARRRPAALLRPAPLLDGLVRHLRRGRAVAVRGDRRGHPAPGLAGRPAARRADRRAGRPCCWWPPRRSPSATTPRPACTRWWRCSPSSASSPSTGPSAIPAPATWSRWPR